MILCKNQINDINIIARKSGEVIMKYYNNFKLQSATDKEDGSPVTKADLAANDLIIKELKILFPDIAVISEENTEQENLEAAKSNKHFIIDPLDGTSAFIKKSDEFTVNIALIEDQKPIFGVIYLPAKDIIYYTNHDGKSCKIENYSNSENEVEYIRSTKNTDDLIVICTKREPEKSEIINDLESKNIKIKKMISISSSYKFCLIAEGKADLYPRRANIKSWDVAAGHAIVNAAGGSMTNLSGEVIKYNSDHKFTIEFFKVS